MFQLYVTFRSLVVEHSRLFLHNVADFDFLDLYLLFFFVFYRQCSLSTDHSVRVILYLYCTVRLLEMEILLFSGSFNTVL